MVRIPYVGTGIAHYDNCFHLRGIGKNGKKSNSYDLRNLLLIYTYKPKTHPV